jgi:hypothetical protein
VPALQLSLREFGATMAADRCPAAIGFALRAFASRADALRAAP